MSKSPSSKDIAASLDVKVQRHKLNSKDMRDFANYVKEQKALDPDVSVSLKDYVQEKFYAGQDNIVVVPDFSDVRIGSLTVNPEGFKEAVRADQEAGLDSDPSSPDYLKNTKKYYADRKEEGLDFSNVDFSGCRMENAGFVSANLEGARFNNADASNVMIYDCFIKGADWRGANISNLRIDEVDFMEEYDDLGLPDELETEINIAQARLRYSGMHFSTTEAMLYRYDPYNRLREEESEARFNRENAADKMSYEKIIRDSEKRVNDAWKEVPNGGYIFGSDKYNSFKVIKAEEDKIQLEARENIARVNNRKFESYVRQETDYVIHPSVGECMSVMNQVELDWKFDPAYTRDHTLRGVENQYVRLTREDAENYLKACEENPELSINEYAASLMETRGIEVEDGARIVADFSAYVMQEVGADNNGVTTDLSGLDFSDRNLGGACFTGANMRDCIFKNAALDGVVMEGGDLTRADFTGASARDANLFAAKIQSAIIKDADFTRAYMPHARVDDLDHDEVPADRGAPDSLRVDGSDFNFADLGHARLDGAKIESSSFEYADLSGVSLANADIRRCNMRHANLERAILNNCQVIETDLSGAILRDAEARKAKFKEAVLEDVDARSMDFTESELDALCKLSGANLEKAIMRKVKADRVKFVGENMEEANLQQASLKGAVVEGVNLRFANLEGAVAEGIKASGVDMTGADLTDIKARGANFKEAKLEGIKAHRSDLSEAVLEGANLRGAKMHDVLLERVNLRKADLRNAEMARAKMDEADVEGAKVNDGTDMHHAEAESAKGEFEHEAADGTKTKMKPEAKVERDNEAHAAKNRTVFGKIGAKIAGAVAGAVAGGLKKIGAFIKRQLSPKWARIVGAALGVALAVTVVATAVLTAGLSIPITAAIIGGAVVACGAGGALAGHVAAKKIGFSAIAAGVAGFFTAGPAGAAAGFAAAMAANSALKKATGKSFGEGAGDAFEGAGEKAQAHADNVKRGDEYAQAQGKSNASYKAPKARKRSEKPDVDRAQEAMDREAAQAKAAQAEASRERATAKKDKAKPATTSKSHDELESEARRVGETIDPSAKTTTHGEVAIPSKGQSSGRERD